ncbi:alcohol dehydrogenase [Penicillium malachiteum]|uniref:alcohol dehydrogenase n=1 Tax=Penicillium malachiteum TaxID=1324776 RepID=UPI0025482B7A|nr:alcohol dehydrogenase [Penicillium malachiteum]KAJ5731440.1 alcohol dehydrogenase [Penicillium malachiteum]
MSVTKSIRTTKAVVVMELKVAAVREVLLPVVRDDWVLVKVKAVAINPTDWKHIDYGAADIGCRVGVDYAGIVEEVGSKVTNFFKGDRITDWTHGQNRADHESGAFAEYAVAKACVQRKIPDNLSFEEAASLKVAIMIIGQGTYKNLDLPLPTEPTKEPFPFLIYGGSTATGMAAIQLAKLSGLVVITTCSPHNFDLMKSLGADANCLRYAFDCTGDGASVCAYAMSDTEPGIYGDIMPADYDFLKATNPKVHCQDFLRGYDTMGEDYYWLAEEAVSPNPDEMDFYKSFLALTQPLLENGSLKPLPMDLNRHGSGLDGVLKGLDELRKGKVSGVRLVYNI